MEAVDHEGWKLTEEGEACVSKGSPEAQVFALVMLVIFRHFT